ncbi:TetR family transcriptional regulator [Frankia sp. AvcI1]|uniref:TetR family transcriptional regulator n=1 Tax=Frankia sp. AvcI1 TaxID=573496 RepID=UPI002117A1BC|nr:TetR family transcriptional regulator [Frankia sp. AvcI1]
MSTDDFQRARSPEAKRVREAAILDAARRLGEQHGVRQVTLTDIAAAVGMHKSAMLRYFETREEIFLRLTAEGWREWAPAVCASLRALTRPVADASAPADADAVAAVFASTLAARALFCDLLAQAPMNLERNVSVARVREFKLTTRGALAEIVAAVREALPGLPEGSVVDLVAAATALAGTFWQIATPSPEIAALYRADPRLAHAIVDVEPRLARILAAMLRGLQPSGAGGQ